jgi:hypothetical protein
MISTEYILFIIQEANFQSTSMMVPYEDFLKVRKDDYDILKAHSVKASVGVNDQEFTVIDNLIVQTIIREGNIGTYKKLPFTDFCHILHGYAYGMDEGFYYDMKDKEWYDKALTSLCTGFNHIENYLKCKYAPQSTSCPFTIMDSFLILDKTIHKKKDVHKTEDIQKIKEVGTYNNLDNDFDNI